MFCIRTHAVAAGFAPRIAALVAAKGFEILAQVTLDGTAPAADAGPGWPGGGPPGVALIALDTHPSTPTTALRRAQPGLDNARTYDAVACVHGEPDGSAAAGLLAEAVDATADSGHAWAIVRHLLAEQTAPLRALVHARRGAFATQEPVLADLTHYGSRAKVELIRYGDGVAVKKTFRAHATGFRDRELAFYRRFGGERPELADVLATGPDYFILSFHPHHFGRRRLFGVHPPQLLPLRCVRGLAGFLRAVLAAGWEPIDLTPANNVLVTPDGMKIVDFEYAWEVGRPVRPERSFCLTGVPADFPGALPAGVGYLRAPYPTQWYPSIGLSLESFLHDPPWLQVLKRTVAYPCLLIAWAARGVVRRLGRAPGVGARPGAYPSPS